MTRRIDVVRSLLRSAAEGTARGLQRVLPVGAIKQMAADLRRRRLSIPMASISRALAHAPDVRSVAVIGRRGRLQIDAAFIDGQALQIQLEPVAFRFAPRGAKELVFRVEPADRTGDRRVAVLTSALAAKIARDLYRPALRGPTSDPGSSAIVDREGTDRLRVDLRTVPAVRNALGSSALALIMEVLQISAMVVDAAGLRLEIALPLGHAPT